ncbi:hypothetical protein VFPPC_17964 [Pochonia chlamydosporia 170]|uniref:Uncharacterized protein n=1 Tax=Pochonia chlamydosporia 170 TaxID=1380566 RepID=A0A219APY1_METCM|nr:hypothetical protein VFPPC_17964 [Pochonia chlamydosporia 170]OWT42843.1 hypothetical protein VFPPC_17964 [Pochonia chlamydosporia 170]
MYVSLRVMNLFSDILQGAHHTFITRPFLVYRNDLDVILPDQPGYSFQSTVSIAMRLYIKAQYPTQTIESPNAKAIYISYIRTIFKYAVSYAPHHCCDSTGCCCYPNGRTRPRSIAQCRLYLRRQLPSILLPN